MTSKGLAWNDGDNNTERSAALCATDSSAVSVVKDVSISSAASVVKHVSIPQIVLRWRLTQPMRDAPPTTSTLSNSDMLILASRKAAVVGLSKPANKGLHNSSSSSALRREILNETIVLVLAHFQAVESFSQIIFSLTIAILSDEEYKNVASIPSTRKSHEIKISQL